MDLYRHWKFATLLLLLTAIAPSITPGQELLPHEAPPASTTSVPRKVVIIGFVGGFVSNQDTRHPEVQFAAYLRHRYPSIHVEVYGNHHSQKALHNLVNFLDTDHNGVLSSLEKEDATVILYGHSWGATETVAFARNLDRMGIPVALTIQVDTIRKPFHKLAAISPNVAAAINFYQPAGLLHGQPEIVAADPSRTKILGNFRLTYEDRPINCNNYSWYSRTFNRPHHLIENDLRLWDELATLIDTDIPNASSTTQAPPSESPYFQYLRRGVQANGVQTPLLLVATEEANLGRQ